jgi:hypothetical protein
MKTRNQAKQEEKAMIAEFSHKFFDASSKAWLANKEKYGQNMYRYKEVVERENNSIVRRSKRLLDKQAEKN